MSHLDIKFQKGKNYQNMSVWANVVFITIAIVLMVVGTIQYERNNNQVSTDSIAYTIEKYAVTCYATEGSYPPDLAYLEKHYGLILDTDNYQYDYEIFGSNVLPSISVFEK